MNRKILSGLALFVLAIYVMHTRTDLPVETQKPFYDQVSVLPFGSIRAGNTRARGLVRSGAEHGTDQVTSDGAAPVGAGALFFGSAQHKTDQVEFNQAKYKIGGIGSDAVAMLR